MNEVIAALESLGIDLVDETGAYLPLAVVLANIAVKWDKLSENDQDQITKSILS